MHMPRLDEHDLHADLACLYVWKYLIQGLEATRLRFTVSLCGRSGTKECVRVSRTPWRSHHGLHTLTTHTDSDNALFTSRQPSPLSSLTQTFFFHSHIILPPLLLTNDKPIQSPPARRRSHQLRHGRRPMEPRQFSIITAKEKEADDVQTKRLEQ